MKNNEVQSLIDNFIEQRDNYDLETQYDKVKHIYKMAKLNFIETLDKLGKAHLFDDKEKHDLLVFICKTCCDKPIAYEFYQSLRVEEFLDL